MSGTATGMTISGRRDSPIRLPTAMPENRVAMTTRPMVARTTTPISAGTSRVPADSPVASTRNIGTTKASMTAIIARPEISFPTKIDSRGAGESRRPSIARS